MQYYIHSWQVLQWIESHINGNEWTTNAEKILRSGAWQVLASQVVGFPDRDIGPTSLSTLKLERVSGKLRFEIEVQKI